jgi:hypothetical protein
MPAAWFKPDTLYNTYYCSSNDYLANNNPVALLTYSANMTHSAYSYSNTALQQRSAARINHSKPQLKASGSISLKNNNNISSTLVLKALITSTSAVLVQSIQHFYNDIMNTVIQSIMRLISVLVYCWFSLPLLIVRYARDSIVSGYYKLYNLAYTKLYLRALNRIRFFYCLTYFSFKIWVKSLLQSTKSTLLQRTHRRLINSDNNRVPTIKRDRFVFENGEIINKPIDLPLESCQQMQRIDQHLNYNHKLIANLMAALDAEENWRFRSREMNSLQQNNACSNDLPS